MVAVLVGAFIWGYGLNRPAPQDAAVTAEMQQPQPADSLPPYAVSSPVSGMIEHRVPVTLTYDPDGRLYAVVESALLADMSSHPSIAIYRDNGLLYTSQIVITSQSTMTERPDMTMMSLQVGEDIIEDRPDEAYLVLSKNPAAKRLPLSALVDHNKADDSYSLWVARLDPAHPERAIAERRSFTLYSKDERYFDAGHVVGARELAILNPDQHLQDGQSIQVRYQTLSMPIGSERAKARYQEANEGKSCKTVEGCMPSAKDGTVCQPCLPARN